MNIKNLKHIRKSVCKGCLTYEMMDEKHICKLPHKKNGRPCPCSTCLVKGVCVQACKLVGHDFDSKNIYEKIENETIDQKHGDKKSGTFTLC